MDLDDVIRRMHDPAAETHRYLRQRRDPLGRLWEQRSKTPAFDDRDTISVLIDPAYTAERIANIDILDLQPPARGNPAAGKR